MLFRDRHDAGQKLAQSLEQYRGRKGVLVLGLARGGVVVAYEVAKALSLPLDVLCPRKVGAPGNPEYAIGAITETGEGIFHQDVIKALKIDPRYVKEAVEEERAEAQKRLEAYRKGRPPRELKGKTVLLVDDGLATGSTMQAAIRSVREEGVESIVAVVPVSPVETLRMIRDEVDEVVCLDTPEFFQAVGQFYEDFGQTSDEEVIDLLK